MRKANPDVFKEYGSIGGNESPTHFDSQTGRIAAEKRWQTERERQNELLQEHKLG